MAAKSSKDLVPVTEIQNVELKAKEITEELKALKERTASLAAAAAKVADEAKGITVETYDDYEKAGKLLTAIRASIKEIEKRVGPLVSAAHAGHKAAKSIENAFSKPLASLSDVIKLKMRALIVREEIRGKSSIEEVELDGEKLAEAYALAETGNQKGAEALLAEAGIFTPENLPEGLPKIEGVSIRTSWSFKVVDEKKVPRKYLIVDAKTIGAVVRAEKDKTNIKGISVFSVPGLAISAK